jgi:hypothetical protein
MQKEYIILGSDFFYVKRVINEYMFIYMIKESIMVNLKILKKFKLNYSRLFLIYFNIKRKKLPQNIHESYALLC